MQELCAEIGKKKQIKNDMIVVSESEKTDATCRDLGKSVMSETQVLCGKKNSNSVSKSFGNGTSETETNGEPDHDSNDGEEGKKEKSKGFDDSTTMEILPPKPMPRSSRSNSIDVYSFEDRPIAKPRTHKNSLESSQSVILETPYKKLESEDDLNILIERAQTCVIQSVNPLMPISGGYKVRN